MFHQKVCVCAQNNRRVRWPGLLVFRSTFLPWVLGALMAVAGVGWLTFVSRQLASSLSPYHYVAGGIGEGLLTVWLLAAGVNAARWKAQAAGTNTL